MYPKDDLNVHDYSSAKLKFALSTIPALGLLYNNTLGHNIKAKVT